MIQFADPMFLWLLLAVPLVAYFMFRRRREAAIKFSDISFCAMFAEAAGSRTARFFTRCDCWR